MALLIHLFFSFLLLSSCLFVCFFWYISFFLIVIFSFYFYLSPFSLLCSFSKLLFFILLLFLSNPNNYDKQIFIFLRLASLIFRNRNWSLFVIVIHMITKSFVFLRFTSDWYLLGLFLNTAAWQTMKLGCGQVLSAFKTSMCILHSNTDNFREICSL